MSQMVLVGSLPEVVTVVIMPTKGSLESLQLFCIQLLDFHVKGGLDDLTSLTPHYLQNVAISIDSCR